MKYYKAMMLKSYYRGMPNVACTEIVIDGREYALFIRFKDGTVTTLK
jgi:hypothetical protein